MYNIYLNYITSTGYGIEASDGYLERREETYGLKYITKYSEKSANSTDKGGLASARQLLKSMSP